MRIRKYLPGTVGVLGAVAFALWFLYAASVRELSGLENALFQFFILGLSVGGSAWIAKVYTSSKTVTVPHARSAVRRLYNIYIIAARARHLLDEGEIHSADVLLECLTMIICDAWEDWKEVIPGEIDNILVETGEQEKT